jgi:site-specific recombinase XerD
MSSDSEYRISHRPDTARGYSPYRLVDRSGTEIALVNDFLDAQAVRGLSERSLRAYGYSLLNFWTWLASDGRSLCELEECDLFDYIRFQRQGGAVAPKTINHRLTAVRSLYRFHCGEELPGGRRSFRAHSHPYHSSVAAETGYLYPSRSKRPQLRVKTPRRLVVPLGREDVHVFLASLRTWRDLSITGLMLFCGLRSREVIELTIEGISWTENEVRIRGKGDKERVVPLPPQVLSLLQSYLEVERPRTSVDKLFVCLKGPRRGQAMTPAGLRSLFRHHRKKSRVEKANPHRFRHTFGSEMARAGISLPALMKLMGHTDIHITMLYVELSAKDVWEEFQRVVKRILRERMIPRADDEAKE